MIKININKEDENELKIVEINNKLDCIFNYLDKLNKDIDELEEKSNLENVTKNDIEYKYQELKHRYDILYKIVSENYPDDIKLYLELADKKEIS